MAAGWVHPLGDTLSQDNPTEADLLAWLEACPVTLEDETRAGVLATVRAAGNGD